MVQYNDALNLASEDLSKVASAYSIAKLKQLIDHGSGGTFSSVVTTGSGNAITSVVASGSEIVVTKGKTFLTEHQSLLNYVTLNTAQTITGDKTFAGSILSPTGGKLTLKYKLFLHTGDATMSVYTHKSADAEDDGAIAIQTCIDGTDGETSAYASSQGKRNQLLLQPRGGSVIIGDDTTGARSTSYRLFVGGSSKFSGNLAIDMAGNAGAAPIMILNGNDAVCSGLNADKLDGYDETSFLRQRGRIDVSYVDSGDDYTSGNTNYQTLDTGVYSVPRNGQSSILIHFQNSGSSVSSLELKTDRYMTSANSSDSIYYRKTIDSNRFSGRWVRFIDELNAGSVLSTGFVTINTAQTITGAKTFSENITLANDKNILFGTGYIRFGTGTNAVYLKYDSTNKALYVEGASGGNANFYAKGNVSAYGIGSTSSGGGLNGSVVQYNDALNLASEDLSKVASAYSIAGLHSKIRGLQPLILKANGSAVTIYSPQTSAVSLNIATGSTNGTILVGGTDVKVKGLGTAAYSAVGDFATSDHSHAGTYTRIFKYTIPASGNKGVRIKYTANNSVKISVSGSNQGAQLMLLGTGYSYSYIRQTFVELVKSPSMYTWCIPSGSTYTCCVEVFSTRTTADSVVVESSGAVTFEAIEALSGNTASTKVAYMSDVEGKVDSATTLSGYGITDAKINNGVITLGGNTIKPLTEHQSLANYVTLNSTQTISGTKIFSVSQRFNNNTNLNFADTDGIYSSVLMFSTTNNVHIGYGTSAKGYDTYINGNNIFLRYGTSKVLAVKIDSSGNVGIGTESPSEKLHVNGNVFTSGYIKFGTGNNAVYLKYDSTNKALYVEGVSGSTANFYAKGNVAAYGTGASGDIRLSNDVYVTGAVTLNGGHLYLRGATSSNSSANTTQLVFGTASAAYVSISALSGTLCINPSASSTTGQVVLKTGTGTTSVFPANLKVNGNITEASSSDVRLKKNIRKVDCISTLKTLGGTYQFEWKKGGKHSIGFIAQNVRKSELKEMVSTGFDGYLKLNYLDTRLISLAVGGVLEVADEITKLKKKIGELEKEVERLKNKR